NQAPNTRKAPDPKLQTRTGRSLEFGAWCFFGVWCLVFSEFRLDNEGIEIKAKENEVQLKPVKSYAKIFLVREMVGPVVGGAVGVGEFCPKRGDGGHGNLFPRRDWAGAGARDGREGIPGREFRIEG